MERYRRLLRIPGTRTTVVLGFLVKLPVIAIPIVLSLRMTLGLGHGLDSAGLATGAWMLGVMAGAPLLGRAMDRVGLRPVLLAAAAAQGAFWGVVPLLPHHALIVGALVSGLLLVPGSTVSRMVLSAQVPPEHQQAAFALDAVTNQLSYVVGPALGAVLASRMSTGTASHVLGCLLVLGLTAFALRARPTAPGAGRRATADAGSVQGLLPILACAFAAGVVASGFEISLLGVVRARGDTAWIGLLVAVCGCYAVVGGLLYGVLPFAVPPWAPVLLLGLTTVPLGAVEDWRVLLVAVMPAAMLSAASFAATSTASSRVATEGNRGRAMGLYGAAVAGGNAAGAPLSGLASGAGGAAAGFVAVGTVATAVALGAWLVRSPAGADEPDTAEKTPPAAARPVPPVRSDAQ
ncbi:MFS transporter [Streptomyces macrosporus]|uniref:MFS transporter n=1 Tax=Streptomyces macrosporus TaxID=44032 RepID=A0ABN3KLS6_9ACTN